MKYLYNPVTGTLDDVETPNLGEKYFASAKTDEIIKTIDDKFGPGTLFPASEAPQPEIKTPQAVFEFGQRNPAADGGMMRQNYENGAEVMTLNPLFPTKDIDSDDFQPLDVPGGFILPAAFTATLAKALDVSADYVKQNPEVLNTKEAKAIGLAFGINIPGVIAPDATEIEKEAEKIREMTKPTGFPAEPPIKIDTTTGDSEPPKIDTTEELPIEDKQLPTSTGGSEIPVPKKGDNIFTFKEDTEKEIKNLDSILEGQALDFYKDKMVNAKTSNEARKSLNKFFTKEREKNPVLNKISIEKASKDGSILYSVNTPDGLLYGKGLDDIISKRDTYFFAKEKPFRDAGYISTGEAASFLKSKGFSTRKRDVSGKGFTTVENDQTKKFNPIVRVLGTLTKRYNIDTKKGPGYGGKQIFVKKSDLEDKIDQIVKDYLPKEEKLALAKNLAEEFNTESFSQINKLLKQRGYSAISNVDLNKYFKKFRGVNVNDPDYIPSGTASSVIQQIRRNKIKTYGAPNVEKVLTAFKKNLGFGQTAELMHPLTKKKATESLYEPEDLMFGSFKENRQYNMGLEGIRNTVQNTLIKTKNNFSPKDLKNNITIEVPDYLRRDFDFPKTMSIKKYIDKLNYMMTDIGLKTDGKIRGALLDENFKLIENTLGVNYRNVPGMGLIEGNLKSLDPLFKKLRYDRSKGYEAGDLLFDNKGMPLLKKGKKLTNEEAEILVTFLSNINKQALKKFSKSQPVSVEEVKEVFKRIPKKKGGVIPDQEIMNYSTGGRVNFQDGTPNPQLDGNDFLNELEFKFNNIDSVTLDDTPITFDDSKSNIAQVADLANPKNIPYYADMAVRAGLRVGEFGTRILPATGQFISDVLQKPMFKVKSSYAREDDNQILDYGETPENNNVKFVGGPIFKNFLKNITPTSTEKLVGLDTLINEEKKKMIQRGSSSLPVKVAETVALGGELIAPIFPGLKLLRAYAKSKNLPANDETKQLLEQDIDMVLESNGMDRRQFLQMTGAGGTVILAKMLGFGDEFATATKVAEKVTQTPLNTNAPSYFYALVDKIKRLGKDDTKLFATQDRQIVTTYNTKNGDYELYEDLTTGSMQIKIRKGDPDFGGYKEEELTLTKGQSDESAGVVPDDYDEYTVRPDGDGKLKDLDEGLEDIDDLIEELGPENVTIKDLEAMGYDINRLSTSIQKKLGIKNPKSPIDNALKNSDDLPDLPF